MGRRYLTKTTSHARETGGHGGQPTSFTIAFQPIVDVSREHVWGYEALVRGENGESAASIFAQVEEPRKHHFDQACRQRAIEMAGRLFPDERTRLSVNFLPDHEQVPKAAMRASLDAASRAGLRPNQLMFEFTETGHFGDLGGTANLVEKYRDLGLLTALDDFGSGYSGLLRLAGLQPDFLKIDMGLVRNISADKRRQAIVAAVVSLARALDIDLIAEGVETREESTALRELGITLFQGFHYARPTIGTLPPVMVS
ncbi:MULTISPECIES: EAL domain-containing protein [Azorhizobium]|nr:EAL domain-containing protein (putative c-di-GMP-specific phosphodiesterase class I) [Azorhizobium sp. AG788]